MFNWIKNIYNNYQAARAVGARYHVSSIVYVIAILTVLGIALMYTEVLNNSVFVDMPGVGKIVRMPRVHAVLGTVGSWLGIPNINDALLLVIVGCILALVVIFILKVVFGGYMNLLFLAVFGYVGQICYKAVISYNMGADKLYENNLLGIHILRALSETERLNTINQAVEAFFTKYEINEGVILTNVTPSDILHLCEITNTLQTKQQITSAVAEYLKENHMNFELYPSLQQEQEVSSIAWVNELLYNAGVWCYAHPYIVATTAGVICLLLFWPSGPNVPASLGKITHKQGESITTLTEINDSQVEYARDAHVQLGLGVKETIAQGEKTHILYNQLSAKTHSMEVDIVNLKEASKQTAGLQDELKGISEQTAGLQHSFKEITDKHTSYDTTNLDFRIRIQELTHAQEVMRLKLIQLTKKVFKDITDIT